MHVVHVVHAATTLPFLPFSLQGEQGYEPTRVSSLLSYKAFDVPISIRRHSGIDGPTRPGFAFKSPVTELDRCILSMIIPYATAHIATLMKPENHHRDTQGNGYSSELVIPDSNICQYMCRLFSFRVTCSFNSDYPLFFSLQACLWRALHVGCILPLAILSSSKCSQQY